MNQSYAGPLWHVVYVEPRCEIDVVSDVAKLGIEAYAPMEVHWSVVRGRKVPVRRPLFQRYIFAGVDPYRQGWGDLLEVDGVIDILGRPEVDDGSYPSRIPSSWIEAMQRAEEAGAFDWTKVNASKFKIGEKVVIDEGPFSGFEAVIQAFIAKAHSMKRHKRAKLLVNMLGRMSSIEIDVAALGKL